MQTHENKRHCSGNQCDFRVGWWRNTDGHLTWVSGIDDDGKWITLRGPRDYHPMRFARWISDDWDRFSGAVEGGFGA